MIRCAVVYFASDRKSPLHGLAASLAEGLKSQNVQVELIDAQRSGEVKMTGYHYVAIGCEIVSWFRGKLPQAVSPFLAQAGIITGKKCFAFVPKTLLGASKTLLNLMKAMEAEGMMIRYSEVLTDKEEARQVGAGLKVQP